MSHLVKFKRVLRKSGGSLAATIPPEIQQAANLTKGQSIQIYLNEEQDIIIHPIKGVKV